MRALDHKPLTDDERSELKKLEQLLATATSAQLLIDGAKEAIELPDTVFQLLQQVVRYVGEGKMLYLQNEEVLTTQKAADMLHVSRPYLIKLLENGEIPFTKVGLHRRIRHHDLVNYLKKRERREEEGLHELARLSQEYGLYD